MNYSLQIQTKIFSRDSNILSQVHLTSNIFGPSATIIWGFGVPLNYPILNLHAQRTSGCGTVWSKFLFQAEIISLGSHVFGFSNSLFLIVWKSHTRHESLMCSVLS